MSDATIIGMPKVRPPEMVCDFCNQPGMVWEYPTQGPTPVALDGGRVLLLRGNFGACSTCSALIEKEDYEALAAQPPMLTTDPGSLAFRLSLCRQFRANRSGPRLPIPSR